jgi:hypothetical protein
MYTCGRCVCDVRENFLFVCDAANEGRYLCTYMWSVCVWRDRGFRIFFSCVTRMPRSKEADMP